MSKLLVVFHGGCDDGFGAAWAFHCWSKTPMAKELYPDGIEYFPGVYGQAPPDCTGRAVILADFCYPSAVMAAMSRTAKSVLVLDHHKSAMLDILEQTRDDMAFTREEWGKDQVVVQSENVTFAFDMGHSGAVLAWSHCFPDSDIPLLIQYIQDRDLWTKDMPYSDAFTAALRSRPMSFEEWDRVSDLAEGHDPRYGLDAFATAGQAILAYQKQLIAKAAENSFWVELDVPMASEAGPVVKAYRIRGANVPMALASEVGEALAMAWGGIGLTWFEDASGFTYSLRSRDTDVHNDFDAATVRPAPDVSIIAKAMGGGGHAKASGFKSKTAIHRRISE